MRVIAAFLIVLLVGCSFQMPRIGIPRVHRITVQQGNVITQNMIDQLKPGMTRSQVAFIMGEPIVRNSFDPDRWDYIYSIQIPNVGTTQRRATLFFYGDLLAYFTGDYAPTTFSAPAAPPVEGIESDAPFDSETDSETEPDAEEDPATARDDASVAVR